MTFLATNSYNSSNKSVLILIFYSSNNLRRFAIILIVFLSSAVYSLTATSLDSLIIPSLDTLFNQILPLCENTTLMPHFNNLKWLVYVLTSLLKTSTKNPFSNLPYFKLRVCKFTVLSLFTAKLWK